MGEGAFRARGGEGHVCVSGHAVVSLVPRHIIHQSVPPEGSCMRYFLAACFLGLGLGVALGLLLVTLGDALESFDPEAAPAFLRLPAGGFRALRSRVIELVDTFSTAHRDANPTPPSQLGGNQASHTSCAAC